MCVCAIHVFSSGSHAEETIKICIKVCATHFALGKGARAFVQIRAFKFLRTLLAN
jgi:hypothetical protein